MEEKRRTMKDDLSTAETVQNELTAEEFPEGSYETEQGSHRPVFNKSTPWHRGQRYHSAFTYDNKTLHQNNPREYPSAHLTHDNPHVEKEPPFENE